jgi:ABC-type polysaccharide/polyol phosphate transport system ATPase subunit
MSVPDTWPESKSHNASQVQEMCDRVSWIEDGHIQQEGDTCEVLEAYRKFNIS